MKFLYVFLLSFFLIATSFSNEEETDESTEANPQSRTAISRGQKVDTSPLRDRYWTAGGSEETRVIQNRAYVKKSHFELGVYYGSTNTDPFVSATQVGGSLGYYLTEQIGLRALYWKHFSSKSSAHSQFDDQVRGAQILITNKPNSFYGGEFVFSPIYGKLSLMGRLIIYYDFYLMLGAGLTRTEIGSHFTPLAGVGQHVFLTQWMTLNMNYRLTYYKELVSGKNRTRLDDVVNIGLNLLF